MLLKSTFHAFVVDYSVAYKGYLKRAQFSTNGRYSHLILENVIARSTFPSKKVPLVSRVLFRSDITLTFSFVLVLLQLLHHQTRGLWPGIFSFMTKNLVENVHE